MSYVGGRFKHDVFFSYAHGNESMRRWSSKVAALVSDALGVLLHDRERELSFWSDEELQLNQPLTAELREQVQSSAALIMVMSGYYLKSPWCRDEGRWFHEARQREPNNSRGTIFMIRAQRIPDDAALPDFLKDERGLTLPGYPFFDDERPNALPWGWNDTHPEKFGSAISRLAEQLAAHLRNRRAQSPTPATLNVSSSVPRVLVGFATEDLEGERAALIEQLSRTEVLELVAPEWPADVNDIREAAKRVSEGCHGLVQLCGRAAGRWRHDADGFVAYQVRLFESSSRPRWLVPSQSLQIEQLSQSPYADFLRSRAADLASVPDPAAVRAKVEEGRNTADRAQGDIEAAKDAEPPICVVFIQSRSRYEASERRLRDELNRLQAVGVHALPIPPVWQLADRRQVSALIELRRRLAEDFDAQLLLLTDEPELLNEDLLDFLREQRGKGASPRIPAAIVDTMSDGAVGVPLGSETANHGGLLPVFRLNASSFGQELGRWLIECTRRRRGATP